jgi:hypothetical protein
VSLSCSLKRHTFVASALEAGVASRLLAHIARGRDALIGTGLLQYAQSLSDLMMIARLKDLSHSLFQIGQSSAAWTLRWRDLAHDVPEQDILDIEADFFSRALSVGNLDSWELISAALPHLRNSSTASPWQGTRGRYSTVHCRVWDTTTGISIDGYCLRSIRFGKKSHRGMACCLDQGFRWSNLSLSWTAPKRGLSVKPAFFGGSIKGWRCRIDLKTFRADGAILHRNRTDHVAAAIESYSARTRSFP